MASFFFLSFLSRFYTLAQSWHFVSTQFMIQIYNMTMILTNGMTAGVHGVEKELGGCVLAGHLHRPHRPPDRI